MGEYRFQNNYLASWIKEPFCWLCGRSCEKDRIDCEDEKGNILSFHWGHWRRIVDDTSGLILA